MDKVKLSAFLLQSNYSQRKEAEESRGEAEERRREAEERISDLEGKVMLSNEIEQNRKSIIQNEKT